MTKQDLINFIVWMVIIYFVWGLWICLEWLFCEGIKPSYSDSVIAMILCFSLYSNYSNWLKKRKGATK